MEGRLDRLGGPPPTRVFGPRAGAELPRDVAALPDLPGAYHDALDRGLAALGLSVPAEARAAIATHVRLLLAWNPAINLTAITEPEAVATRHVLDSLTAAALLDGDAEILDLGSGGGFPGLPLAAVLPEVRATLVDSVAKKAAFLEVAVAGAGLAGRVSVVAARAEAIAASRPPALRPNVVLARGVAELGVLVELAMPLLEPGGKLVAWKRGDLTSELEAASRAAAFLGADAPVVVPVESLTATRGPIRGLAGHLLVTVRKARPTPAGFPRDPAARRRRPW